MSLLFDRETGHHRLIVGGCFEILGAAIGTIEHCTAEVGKRVRKVLPTLDAISNLPDPQVGLRLLRVCAGFGKLVYSCRTAPPDCHGKELAAYDEPMCAAFSSLTGIDVSDAQWSQAGRGLADAGLGWRSAHEPAPAAYISSRTCTRTLFEEVDTEFSWDGGVADCALGRSLLRFNTLLPAASHIVCGDDAIS